MTIAILFLGIRAGTWSNRAYERIRNAGEPNAGAEVR
jgi:hypothetical protein